MHADTISGAPAAAASTSATSPRTITSDFQTFLQMLTVQMENQDPLNPTDSSDYAVQLATFSSVEQQVQTNQLLTALTSQLATNAMVDYAAWVGRDARSTAPVQFNGSPITISPEPASDADAVELVVRDSNGSEVQRLQLPASSEPIEWAGVDTRGAPFPAGQYTFEVISKVEGETILTETAETYATVREVRTQNGETFVILEGNIPMLASQITAVRAPNDP